MPQDLLFECIGTAILILLGDGVVANVILKGTKGHNGGWAVITIAWGLAVYIGAYVSGPYSGAHLNPALTIGLALAGKFSGNVMGYIIAQMLGGLLGAVLVYLFYKQHFDIEEDKDTKLGVFCTIPAIRNYFYNFVCEVIGTFMLVFGLLFAVKEGTGFEGPFPAGLLVMVIGMSLGGTTGYAINPARDLAPRIAHFILPIKGKRDSDWKYSWVPVLGPIAGAAIAAGAYLAIV